MLKKMLISTLAVSQMMAWEAYSPVPCCDTYFIEAEYLYWKIEDSKESTPLVVELPSTVVLNTNDIEMPWRSGGRFTVGYWLEYEPCFGTELGYFFLPTGSKSRSVHADGEPGSATLRIPFYNVSTLQHDSTGLATPGVFAGRATLKLENEIQGVEWNFLAMLPCFCGVDAVAFGGFRYLNFEERLSFKTSSPFVSPPFDVYKTEDHFHTINNFYGAQLGISLASDWGPFFVSGKAKVAVGAMCEEVIIKGRLLTNDYDGFGLVQKFKGGYYALPSNIGKHKKNLCAVIPEVGCNVGYRFCDSFELKLGYSCFYVSNVLRSGKQISRQINPTGSVVYSDTPAPILVGLKRPRALLKTESLWVQGVNVGLGVEF